MGETSKQTHNSTVSCPPPPPRRGWHLPENKISGPVEIELCPFDLVQPYSYKFKPPCFSADVFQPCSVLFSASTGVSINLDFTKIRFCDVSGWNEWVHGGQFFHKWKANAGLYRMRFIFGLFLCQWGYLMDFSAGLIGIYSECSLSAEVSWDLSRSQDLNSQYLDRWPQRKHQWFSRHGPSCWVSAELWRQTTLCCRRTCFLFEISETIWTFVAI